MRTHLSIGLVLAVSALAATAHAGVKVVATVPDLAALTKEIGGDKVSVTALSLPTQDPHFVDAKPSIVLKLNQADLLVAVGLELEIGWMPALQTQARNAKILAGGAGYLDCSRAIEVRDMASGAVDRSQGDIHPNGNPHYLYDPRQAARCAQAIGDKLIALDGGNARTYRANLSRFLASLAAARKGWEQRLAPFRGRTIVSYHKSMTYLVDWLGLVEVATLEPKPGIPPTPSHVASVIKLGKDKAVKAILQESFYPDKTCTLVAKKIGATVVRLPAGADVSAGETYVQHMGHVIDDLEGALK
jgi:zinc/manganese transport system substrate-binding protein